MDVTYSSEWDAARYGRLVKKTLALSGHGGASPWTWSMMVGGLLLAFSTWLRGNGSLECYFICGFLISLPLSYRWVIHRQIRQYVKIVERQLGGEKVSQKHLTDEAYEVTCGAMSQKMPWKNLGVYFHFFDDAAVAFLQPNCMTSLVLDGLSSHNVDRGELEGVLRRAGMKSLSESKKPKVRKIVQGVFYTGFLALMVYYAAHAVSSCRYGLQCQETQVQLFDLIHGKDDPRRPVPNKSLRGKVARLLTSAGEPDEMLYIFAPEEEFEKVGLYARYGKWSYEAFYPCGCACCQNPGYFDHIKELHAPTVYLESEKDKWLEKIRPLANDLYEPEWDADE